jgi:nitroreductase
MREKIKPLLDRRSIRTYEEKQITDEELYTVLEAGKHAPSGMNEHKLKFVVFRRGGVLDVIIKDLKRDPFYGAPTMVTVFVDEESRKPVPDGCLAIGNMLNAAHMLELGSCWVSSMEPYFDTEEGKALKDKYQISSNYICAGAFVLGYQKGDALPRELPENLVVIAE